MFFISNFSKLVLRWKEKLRKQQMENPNVYGELANIDYSQYLTDLLRMSDQMIKQFVRASHAYSIAIQSYDMVSHYLSFFLLQRSNAFQHKKSSFLILSWIKTKKVPKDIVDLLINSVPIKLTYLEYDSNQKHSSNSLNMKLLYIFFNK